MALIRIFILLLAVWIVTPGIADIPLVGEKQYSYRYIINNSADYPDYTFFTSSEIWQYAMPTLVVNGSFGGGYKLDGFILHAVKNSEIDPAVLDLMGSTNQEEKNLTPYLEKAPIRTADVLLPVSVSLDKAIPVDNISVVLLVNALNETAFTVTKVKTLYGFENGTTGEEIFVENPDNESSGRSDLGMESLQLFS